MDAVRLVNVFASDEGGGSPTPIVLDASGYELERMLAIARQYGHECAFVFPPQNPAAADFRFRFFVPRQEMNMCGHATLGTLWLLRRMGKLARDEARIETLSGVLHGSVRNRAPRTSTSRSHSDRSRPRGRHPSAREAIMTVLGVGERDLLPLPILNAVTSRTKTLVPLQNVKTLDGLKPDFSRMEPICTSLDSTGLYPLRFPPFPRAVSMRANSQRRPAFPKILRPASRRPPSPLG